MSAPFAARYPGRCADCHEDVEKGDVIRMTDTGAIHDDCEDIDLTTRPAERPVETCDRCWLQKPCFCEAET